MDAAGRDNEKQDGKYREKPSHGLLQRANLNDTSAP
jgi:hypothetical protein